MKKIAFIFISLLLFSANVYAQKGVSLIGQTKQYVINECSDLYIIENTDDEVIFKESDYVRAVYLFKDGLCYMFCQVIDDAEIAEGNFSQLKEKMNFKEDYDNGVTWNAFYDGFIIRYIPPSNSSPSWTFLYMKNPN